ncbi:MAG TPA: flagellar hook-basal body complex protein FliE [Nocardioidaceae bacterium]|nr:flagellar hook-basal body complex protein FliE [Nocardioidaceae bacterium]
MSIPAIPAISSPATPPMTGFTPLTPQVLPATTQATDAAAGVGATGAASSAGSADFASMLSQGISHLEGLQDKTDQLAVQAATGDLDALHDYTITATEAQVATQLTTAVRNKALEAFQEIMRMSV